MITKIMDKRCEMGTFLLWGEQYDRESEEQIPPEN